MKKITSKWTFWVFVSCIIGLIGVFILLYKDAETMRRTKINYPNVLVYNKLKSTLSTISNDSILNGETENYSLSEEYITILNKEIKRISFEISVFEKDDSFMIVINDLKILERYFGVYLILSIFLSIIMAIVPSITTNEKEKTKS